MVSNIDKDKEIKIDLKEIEKNIFNSIQEVVFQMTATGIIKWVSPSVQEVYGYNRHKLIGKRFISTTPINEIPKVLKILKDTILGKTIKNLEIKQLNSNKDIIFMELNTRPVKEKGRIVGFTGVMRDISERKKTESGLLNLEILSSSIIDASPNYVCMLDTDGMVQRINRSPHHDIGIEDIIGTNILKSPLFTESGNNRDFDSIFEQVVRTGKFRSIETKIKASNRGEAIYYFNRFTLLNQSNNTSAHFEQRSVLLITTDITELKKNEKELEKAHNELKNTTAQLVQNERLAALGELTAGVSHELKQPLNNIKIVCQEFLMDIRKNRVDMTTLPQSFKDLVGQVNKMSEIIDHMRLYTRNINNQLKEEININEPISNMFILLNEQLRRHNIDVVKDLSPDLPKVSATSIALEQVFTNFVTNARNAIEDSNRKNGEIRIKSFKKNKDEVAVSIQDNGGGVPPNIRNRIFEPFFTNRPPGKGVGLGLSIASKIVQEHEGGIKLEVKEGIGSTFTITLPIVGRSRKGD